MDQKALEKEITPKIKEYLQEQKKLLDRIGLTGQLTMTFPDRKFPILARIGVWFISRAKGKLEMSFRLKS